MDVLNQPPPLEPYNLLESDLALREGLVREGAGWALPELTSLGEKLGDPETVRLGFEANANPPRLHGFDRYGNRLDEVEFHPAWHELLGLAVSAGLHSSPWASPRPGAHVARAAGGYMLVQIESGVYCPVAMTYGSVPTLRRAPEIAAAWLPRIYATEYDRRCIPADQKSAALIGMSMTEKQGGSDLRTNETRAVAAGANFALTGHKWFMSAPMCDAFLVLANEPGGLSCFLVPRWTPDGTRNAIRIQRLKDKLGNRSNASAEVELEGAFGQLVGESGRGIPTIIETSNYTRLDCTIGSAGLMRQATAQAIHHASHRSAFQRRLVDQPIMMNVLADLAIESEAAAMLAMRLARAYDEADEGAQAFRRIVTPAAKFWICKRAPFLAAEALEVLGGNGYIEESVMPRIYREAPVNAIWEGASNVMCLDVRRAAAKIADAAAIVVAEIGEAANADRRLKSATARLERRLADVAREDEGASRALARDLVLALQAALLVKFSTPQAADAFCASRLDGDFSGVFGALPLGRDFRAIIERAAPTAPL
jgi:putative acyl-CoA dehydrogenase